MTMQRLTRSRRSLLCGAIYLLGAGCFKALPKASFGDASLDGAGGEDLRPVFADAADAKDTNASAPAATDGPAPDGRTAGSDSPPDSPPDVEIDSGLPSDTRRADMVAALPSPDAQPTCGDGVRQGPEKCDGAKSGSTALGACDPECTGYYEKKRILGTAMRYPGNLGGISGADQICQKEHGDRGGTWKALLVGGDRRATVTPSKGDGQLDWVIKKYRHYYNETDELLWRTDEVALLGVREGKRMSIYAKAFLDFRYPWSGYATDWTTVEGDEYGGHCFAWTYSQRDRYGSFPMDDLTKGAGEPCDRMMPLLCVEQ